MPSRIPGARQAPSRQGAQAPTRSVAQAPTRNQPTQQQQPTGSDAIWDDIMNRKQGGGGDDGEFNKFNTNFYLSDGEDSEIVLLDGDPIIFWGHTIKGKWDSGSTFYRVEQCQKSQQGHCVLCDSDNKAVGTAKSMIAFRVLDSRGLWDKKTSDFDYIPFPKIFFTPLYLAKQIKTLLDDVGGEITDKILRLQKNGQYTVNFKLLPAKHGNGLEYAIAPEYEGDLPEILDVYAPQEDGDLIDFVRKYADAGTPPARGGNTGRGGNTNNNAGRNGQQGNGFGR